MILKQVTDALGLLQAAASPITLLLNNSSTNVYIVIPSKDSVTIGKTGVYLDISIALGGQVQVNYSMDLPASGEYYTLAPGDVLRVKKALGASLGSLEAIMEIDDPVFLKEITISAQNLINEQKQYWILAGLATALGVASIVSGVTKANVEVAGYTTDGADQLAEIVGGVSSGYHKPTQIIS